MKILAIDTSSPRISVAVADSDRVLFKTDEIGSPSVQLISCIEKTLKGAGLGLRQIDGFVIGEGPGSYNGLRCGFATLHGLLIPRPRRAVKVSSLAAMVSGVEGPEMRGAILNARKNSFFFGKFRLENAGPKLIEEGMVERIEQISGIDSPEIAWLSYEVEGFPVAYPDAAALVRLGRPELEREPSEKILLEPRYLRPPV